MSAVSQSARREIVRAVASRYRKATRREKTMILDEFVRITRHHRKHAIRLLGGGQTASTTPSSKPQRRLYDEAVRQTLIVLWEASDRICGKRLKPLVPLLVKALTDHGHLSLDETVRSKLLQMSASTIDRLLAPVRADRGPPASAKATSDRSPDSSSHLRGLG